MMNELFSFDQTGIPDDARITYFGLTDSRNKKIPFGIKKEDRSRHTYVIGKTGMGKSTLLENMAAQDIINNEGLCFIDPHGGSADKLLEYIPEHRVKDVLYFAPFDLEYPISFNVLEKVDADKRHLVVAGLMSTFEKIWVDAWSARMAYILQNTLGALLEFPGATLLSVNRMYIDKEYRKHVIANITDPSVRSFWVDEYSKYTDRYAQEATPAIQNKIGQFASNALIRNVIGQPHSSFNIRELMDQKKIFIVNLSKGRVGEGNANLLGSMLITKIYLAAMSRADTKHIDLRNLPPFYLYVDEFQNFANKSFADILSEARKYKLALTIAHQYIEQMEDEVRAAVFGNVGTMITFRVGAYDAEVLEKEFAPVFSMEDLVNLGARQIYLKLMIDGVSSHPFSAVTMPPVPEPTTSHIERAVAFSRAQYSHPREEVEESIRTWVSMVFEDPNKEVKEKVRNERYEVRVREQQKEIRNNSASQQSSPPRVHTPNSETVKRSYTQEKVRTPRNAQQSTPHTSQHANREDLRSLLAKMTQQNHVPSAPVHDGDNDNKDYSHKQPQQGIQTVGVTPLPHVEQQKKKQPFQPKKQDDGKSITPQGREELRSLLSALVSSQPISTKEKKEDVPIREQGAVTITIPKEEQQKKADIVTEKKEENVIQEFSREQMEELLHVDKPIL